MLTNNESFKKLRSQVSGMETKLASVAARVETSERNILERIDLLGQSMTGFAGSKPAGKSRGKNTTTASAAAAAGGGADSGPAAAEDDPLDSDICIDTADGLIDLDELGDAITEQTALVSVMAVNNEIGVIQPIAKIGAICRERDVFFHTDAAQAAARLPLNVENAKIDLMSLSGHKVYAPMGIGALYVRRRPRVRLQPLFSGGQQEQGLRPGTLAAPLCVGFGLGCEIAAQEMADENKRLLALSTRFLKTILSRVPGAILNGDRDKRISGNLNFSFPGVQAEDLMAALKELAISNGSACTSGSTEPSHVLKALGLNDDLVLASIRVGFGRFTTEEEIDFAAEKIAAAVDRLARINPRQNAPAA